MWKKCIKCKRSHVCESNLKKIRLLVCGGVLGGGGLGAALLPLFGFGAGGIVAGSLAASWQSSIGAVAASSLFATLQSLGATGVGVLLFGGIGAGLGLLVTLAAKLGWCNDDCDYNSPKFQWEKCSKCKNPLVNDTNLLKLRVVTASGFIRDSSEGAELLSLMGFHAEGISAELATEEWFSCIDTHAANRLFRELRTLENAELSVLLFGDKNLALRLLTMVVHKLGWCNQNCMGKNSKNDNSKLLAAPHDQIISSSEIVLTNLLIPAAEVIPATTKIPNINEKNDNKSSSKLKEIFSWEICPKCKRPLVCEINLLRIRLLVALSMVASGTLGTFLLRMLGFGAKGIIKGSIAAAWQSSIGHVAADSMFSKLQSWNIMRFGKFIFGNLREAVTFLPGLVDQSEWCNSDCDYNDKDLISIK